MSKPVFDPGNGGCPATQDVAELITALHLPAIESFGPNNPALDGLPDYTSHPAPVPEPPSRVSIARAAHDSALAALAALKGLEDRTAACKAAVVDRLMAATNVEAAALALDGWQSDLASSAAIAEIATTLCIAEGTAKVLVHYSTELVGLHPQTLANLDAGILSWRHACIIVNETQTLAETPSMNPADVAEFEKCLLAAALGTTASGFASKSRRMREGTHPETLITRVRQAISTRSLALEPGKDGMSWLILHIPATAASGVFVNCTRTARAQQGPDEHRTLGQLRANTAAALLLGKHPLAGSGNTGPGNAGSGKAEGLHHPTRGGGSWTESQSRQTPGAADDQAGGIRQAPPPGKDATVVDNPFDVSAHAGAPGEAPSGDTTDIGTYDGFRLVDVLPDWAHGPRDPMIGPLNEAANVRAEAWASAPENICVMGTVCPDIPRQSDGNAADSCGGEASDGSQGKDDWATAGGSDGNPDEEPDRFPASRDSSANGGLGPDGSGLVDGIVDGIPEDPVQDYLDQLEATRNGSAVTDPPEPEAQIIVTVPVLGLLGLTDEPAQLTGHGPIPEEIARKLLRNAGSFLRVLTDPVTGNPLKGPLPERYRLREAEKTLLHALNESCSFPNCSTPSINSETDHIRPYSQGGGTIMGNIQPLCKRHHTLKHFRDDKDRNGRFRQDLDPSRASIKLRGWKPVATPEGGVAWTSPSGKYHPPQRREAQAPAYPKWLKRRLDQGLSTGGGAQRTPFGTDPSSAGSLPEETRRPRTPGQE
ncbi:HNH endonuclease signature motif containing protein [Arthrobacter sp. GMC3]|uniref:HNH endonuclease signature motif containing protein n=1 Tax=Arthrobacter sp. GMC3 TaxID=2058894 RepID=UPI000CE3459E|nr:HNH endonuclease signature motif containing protein [Arthrobacter sp. GMC3]